jgi:hypothetical protein
MNNLHNSMTGQMEKEKKLRDFLNEYATEDEIDQLGLHIDNKEFDQADMVIYTIMARITG